MQFPIRAGRRNSAGASSCDPSPSASPTRAWRWLAGAAILGVATLLALPACDESGGPNVEASFRVVFLEPSAGATSIPCKDTIRVTFNHPIDTTAVYDPFNYPHYFIAGIAPSAAFDSLGVTLSNPETDVNGQPIPGTERTLNLPFEFLDGVNYTFDFNLARDQDGRELETRASTVFQTTADCGDTLQGDLTRARF